MGERAKQETIWHRLGRIDYRYIYAVFIAALLLPSEPPIAHAVMQEDIYLYMAYREHVDEWLNCTGPRFETNVTLGLYKAYIAVTLRNTGADCLEVYVRYNITEGADRLGNISTGSGGGMNVGSAYCLPSGEKAQWWLIFLPCSLGKVVILISSEGRYIEWGEPKVYKLPEHEIVLHIVPRDEP